MKHIPLPYLIASLIAAVLSVTSSVAYGLLDGRWVAQPDLQAAASQLERIPDQLGDWVFVEERELEEAVQQVLRCYGHSHRVYQNAKTGSRVTIALMFGPRGPIAVHTPEICYSGQGVQAAGERKAVAVGSSDSPHQLWQLAFLSNVDQQPAFEVHYGWSDGGNWQAATQPRLWMTDRLYKIQVAGPATPAGQASESLEFLSLYLAAVTELLAQSS